MKTFAIVTDHYYSFCPQPSIRSHANRCQNSSPFVSNRPCVNRG